MLLFADLFLFLSLYPRLLRLLLLPYTTLFRSAVGWLVRVVAVVVGLVGQATHRHRLRQHVVQRAVVGQDRERTGLNCSDLGGSYAVLCLEKKSASRLCMYSGCQRMLVESSSLR